MENKTWLINGNALKKAFIDVMKTCESTVAVRFWSIAIDAIQDKAFHADAVEVVHGRWVEHPHISCDGGYNGADFECSRCGFNDVYDIEDYNYCPNCGAKMDGRND